MRTVPTFQDIRGDILRDIRAQRPTENTSPESDHAVRANATGAAVEGLYQHQEWLLRQAFPHSADKEALEQHCRERGLERRGAVSASGQVIVTGVIGASISAGTELRAQDGQVYTVRGNVTLTAISQAVVVDAATAGATSNRTPGEVVTFLSPPSGIAPEAVVSSVLGGMPSESDDDLRARLLEDIRHPPAGGNRYDYIRWAKLHDAVRLAHVMPVRRGPNTVDIAVLGANNAALSPVQLAEVQALIDDLKPAGADSLVMLPTALVVNLVVVLTLSGVSLDEARAMLTERVATYFATLAPGDAVLWTRLVALIATVPGVVDFALSAPIANVYTRLDSAFCELAVLGTVIVSSSS